MNNDRESQPARRLHRSQPSITKRDVVLANHMVQQATTRHRSKAADHDARTKDAQVAEGSEQMVQDFRKKLLKEEEEKAPKTELGQQLVLEHVEKRVNGFKLDLKRKMKEQSLKTPPPSPHVRKSSTACRTTTQPHTVSRTPKRHAPSHAPSHPPEIELSPTGFATFPRFGDPEEDSKEEEANVTDAEVKSPKKGLLSGWFASK